MVLSGNPRSLFKQQSPLSFYYSFGLGQISTARSMASIANFVVFTRRSSDPSLGWEDNPPNTPVYTYVASAINIALSILESPHGRHYLTQLALIIDHEMDENSHFQGNKDIAKHWVDVFLAKVRAQFPVVIVDFTMNNPNELGCHPRGGWMGHLKDFDPRSHMICINGQV